MAGAGSLRETDPLIDGTFEDFYRFRSSASIVEAGEHAVQSTEYMQDDLLY